MESTRFQTVTPGAGCGTDLSAVPRAISSGSSNASLETTIPRRDDDREQVVAIPVVVRVAQADAPPEKCVSGLRSRTGESLDLWPYEVQQGRGLFLSDGHVGQSHVVLEDTIHGDRRLELCHAVYHDRQPPVQLRGGRFEVLGHCRVTHQAAGPQGIAVDQNAEGNPDDQAENPSRVS